MSNVIEQPIISLYLKPPDLQIVSLDLNDRGTNGYSQVLQSHTNSLLIRSQTKITTVDTRH